MIDRFPRDSVLVPQWTRVEDGLPKSKNNNLSLVVRDATGARWVEDGYYDPDEFGGFMVVSYDGMEFEHPSGTVTHYSPRVGIPLPEEE